MELNNIYFSDVTNETTVTFVHRKHYYSVTYKGRFDVVTCFFLKKWKKMFFDIFKGVKDIPAVDKYSGIVRVTTPEYISTVTGICCTQSFKN